MRDEFHTPLSDIYITIFALWFRPRNPETVQQPSIYFAARSIRTLVQVPCVKQTFKYVQQLANMMLEQVEYMFVFCYRLQMLHTSHTGTAASECSTHSCVNLYDAHVCNARGWVVCMFAYVPYTCTRRVYALHTRRRPSVTAASTLNATIIINAPAENPPLPIHTKLCVPDGECGRLEPSPPSLWLTEHTHTLTQHCWSRWVRVRKWRDWKEKFFITERVRCSRGQLWFMNAYSTCLDAWALGSSIGNRRLEMHDINWTRHSAPHCSANVICLGARCAVHL